MNCKFVKTEWVHEKTKKPLVVCSRAGCRRHGFIHEPEKLRAECFSPHLGLGDAAHVAIKVLTLGLLKTCGNCLKRKLKMNKWLNWPLPDWLVKVMGFARKLPWKDPAYIAKLRITRV